jgi:hypothetical protein
MKSILFSILLVFSSGALADTVRVSWSENPSVDMVTHYSLLKNDVPIAGTVDINEYIDSTAVIGDCYQIIAYNLNGPSVPSSKGCYVTNSVPSQVGTPGVERISTSPGGL